MRRILIGAAVAAATWVGDLDHRAPLAQTAAPASAHDAARVIVKYRADSPLLRKQALSVAGQQTLQAAALGNRIGVSLDAGRAISDRSHVVFARGLSSAQLAARIAAQGDVEYAVADERKRIVAAPNDPRYASHPAQPTNGGPLVGQWFLKPPGPAGTAANTAPSAINAEQAWDITQGSASIVVAVLDTGVRFDHPDLQGGSIVPGYDMVREDSAGDFTSAGDGDGRDPDASDPGDFVSGPEAASLGCAPEARSSWHGTQTLGVIGAATNNGIGVAGVGRAVRVMPIRVLGKCGGYDSDIQAGIRWAAGLAVPDLPPNPNPARVINMSLGGDVACAQSYVDAIGQANAAGVVVVASAGNSAGHPVSSPANCTGAIAVAGLRHVGSKVGFSDVGPQIAISAPGGNCVNTGSSEPCLYPIATTTNAGVTSPVAGGTYTDSFDTSLGTSFSSPLVAGTVGLMLSVQPALTPAQVKARLQSSARPFPTTGGSAGVQACVAPVAGVDQLECYCTTSTCGAGMLDARAAVQSVNGVLARISLTTTTPTAGQSVALTSNSAANPGQSVATYAWTILNAGTTGATIVGAADGASVVVAPAAAGSFVVELTTTDNTGFTSKTDLRVDVVAAPGTVTPPASAPPATSDGGGGALGAEWLLLLLGAVSALAMTARRAAPLSAAGPTDRD